MLSTQSNQIGLRQHTKTWTRCLVMYIQADLTQNRHTSRKLLLLGPLLSRLVMEKSISQIR